MGDAAGTGSDWARPTPSSIHLNAHRAAFDHVFRSGTSFAKLKENATDGHLFPASLPSGIPNASGVQIPGRSIAWKLFLTPVPPLTPALSNPPTPALASLRESRAAYVVLLKQKLRAPDGGYEEGLIFPGEIDPPAKLAQVADNWETNNPLSLDDQNPWREWFAAVELRKTIRQDVDRTFPDIPYFRDTGVQALLTTILFLHAISFPQIGYRQGMHELLAPLLLAIDTDSLDSASGISDPTLLELCDRTWIGADAWTLFELVMQGVGQWYEWREPPSPDGGTDKQLDAKPFVTPIVATCNRVQNQFLNRVDPSLCQKLSEKGIEPQIYGIRWLRLLFTREFPLNDSLILWDGLFAVDPTLAISPWICVAMLVRIRNQLIPSDYSGQLTYLLRYPSNPTLARPDIHPISVLLKQAVRLRKTPTTSTGATIVLENRNLLRIPIEVPEEEIPQPRRRSVRPGSAGERPKSSGGAHDRRDSQPQANLSAIPEMFARGLLDRSESLGINRAVMGAVSEIKRNWNELPANLSRPNLSQTSSISMTEEERPPWEPRPRSEIETEIRGVQATQKKLADAVGWAVDVLLQSESEMQPEKREALECLAYVRDVLLRGGVGPIEEDRLVGEKELQKRKQKAAQEKAARDAEKLKADPTRLLEPPNLPPQALSVSEPTRIRTYLSTRDSRPTTSLPRTPYSPTSHTAHHPSGPNTIARHEHRLSGSFQPTLTSPTAATFSATSSKDRAPIPPWHGGSRFSYPSAAGGLPRIPPQTATPGVPLGTATSTYPPRPQPTASTYASGGDPLGALR